MSGALTEYRLSTQLHVTHTQMPLVPYTASNFPRRWGPALAGRHDLRLSWHEIVWAAMLMGKAGVAFLLAHGWHSVSDLVVRSHTIYANLRENSSYLERSSLYTSLDPTEKSGVSYFMGMVAAKVLGARLLGTPWLFHVSMIKALGGAVALKGNSQPDLIGLRQNRDWVVAEAKGRSWGYSASAMTTAKLQTRQLRKINGQFPALRVAVQASFSPKLEWAIEDPEEFDEDAVDLQFNLEGALEMYYSAPNAAVGSGQSRLLGRRNFLVRELPEIGVTVGIDREVRDRLQTHALTAGKGALMEDASPEPKPDGDFLVFSDGLAVSLDARWAEERMTRDPWMRRDG